MGYYYEGVRDGIMISLAILIILLMLAFLGIIEAWSR